MNFEWDEAKRLSNMRKHGGLDFYDAIRLFKIPHAHGPAAIVDGEVRWMVTGLIGNRYVTVVYTLRGDVVRIISMRRARHEEKRKYRALHER